MPMYTDVYRMTTRVLYELKPVYSAFVGLRLPDKHIGGPNKRMISSRSITKNVNSLVSLTCIFLIFILSNIILFQFVCSSDITGSVHDYEITSRLLLSVADAIVYCS